MADDRSYEQIKKEREQKRAARGKQKQQKQTWSKAKPVFWSVVILGLLVLGAYYLIRSQSPQTVDQSVSYPEQGRQHIAPGTPLEEPYNSNPPTSGAHYDQPARPGFRGGEDIADGHLIHSLEHGLIWISYRPDVGEAVIEALKEFDNGTVVITERAGNDHDIAVAAWTRLDTFDVGETLTEEEVQRIRDFIARHVNRGPEFIPPGQHGGV